MHKRSMISQKQAYYERNREGNTEVYQRHLDRARQYYRANAESICRERREKRARRNAKMAALNERAANSTGKDCKPLEASGPFAYLKSR